jgi:hypothetical protein
LLPFLGPWLLSSWSGLPYGGVVMGCRSGWVGFGIGRLGELFGKALVFGACGVEVAFCPLGTDAQRVAGFFQGGNAGAGGGGELV